MEALANDIQQFTDGFKETEESRERRNELRRRIKEIVNENHPDANVVIVGSCGNGFGIMFSDLDLTVILSSRISFRSSIHQLLLKIEKGLKRDSSSYTDIEVVSHATVPIITFKYRCEAETLSCDVSVNTRNNIFNGVLLKAYSQLDGRVKPLMLVLKHWAKECGVIQSRYNRLSSFTFALMVIHYLQSGCHPIVLPSLQNTRQAFFNTSNDNVDAITRYINDPLPQTILSFKSTNTKSIGELFAGFFEHYCSFNWGRDGISVRDGENIRRPLKQGSNNTCLYVEDPYERNSNTARGVYKETIWGDIKDKFQTAKTKVSNGRSLSEILCYSSLNLALELDENTIHLTRLTKPDWW